MAPFNLLDFSDEILSLVVDQAALRDGGFRKVARRVLSPEPSLCAVLVHDGTLMPLSLVCSRLRRLVIPVFFREAKLRVKNSELSLQSRNQKQQGFNGEVGGTKERRTGPLPRMHQVSIHSLILHNVKCL